MLFINVNFSYVILIALLYFDDYHCQAGRLVYYILHTYTHKCSACIGIRPLGWFDAHTKLPKTPALVEQNAG